MDSENINYSLDEVGLSAAVLCDMESRSDVNPFDENGKLPIFVSPMTCIMGRDNFKAFEKSKAIPIMPVWHNFTAAERINCSWAALTLDEFFDMFVCEKADKEKHYNILIDTANGHMRKLYMYAKKAKASYGNSLTLMIGNIENPETYLQCCMANIDYVRVGVGGGSGCLSSVKTGMHASLFYLLQEIKKLQKTGELQFISEKDAKFKFVSFSEAVESGLITRTKVIADGGVNNIGKAVKCLALGADYVMCGYMFALCKEAGSVSGIGNKYYGQASELGQIDRFGKVRRYEEGTVLTIERIYSIDKFLSEFENSLRSAMTYANAWNLEEFRTNTKYHILSEAEFKSFNK